MISKKKHSLGKLNAPFLINAIVATKTISQVDIEKNKMFRYTGKLFDNLSQADNGKSSSTLPITIDDEWGETVEKTF
ncbi:MAG: hypothetical protein FWF52_11375 [Candidatus Azobacteroides sp.]|nr:hypothetical protein [Candidatus Azobacteroides sp.]